MNNDKNILEQQEDASINKFAIKQGIIEFFFGVLLIAGGICTFIEFILIFIDYLFSFLFGFFIGHLLTSKYQVDGLFEMFVDELISVFQRPYFWIGVLLLILRYVLGKINKKYVNNKMKDL